VLKGSTCRFKDIVWRHSASECSPVNDHAWVQFVAEIFPLAFELRKHNVIVHVFIDVLVFWSHKCSIYTFINQVVVDAKSFHNLVRALFSNSIAAKIVSKLDVLEEVGALLV
jgi:hypothetical protein